MTTNQKRKVAETIPLGNPSTSCGDKCFSWMIAPMSIEEFTSQYWEKKPMVIKRDQAAYFTNIISRRSIETYLKSDPQFSVTSLFLAREGTDEQEIQSEAEVDLQTFARMIDEDGWRAQVVQPQDRNARVHALLERLENWSGSLWGCNYYLSNSFKDQVFRAYSDNVELFILQLDGECHWRVYDSEQKLSRDSGNEYTESDLGLPILDEIVAPGDLVYIPRGCIYSVNSKSGKFQYLNLSTYQNQAWCDMLTTSLTETLEKVTSTDISFRQGLPNNWTAFLGKAVVETDANRDQRAAFRAAMKARLTTLIDSIDVDDIADQMASDFVALRTPPVVRMRAGDTLTTFGPDPRLNNDLKIRVRNPNWIRVVVESSGEDVSGGGKILVFSCLDNDVKQHMKTDNPLEAEPTSLEMDGSPETLNGFRDLIAKWPEFVSLDVLNRDILGELWEHRIVETVDESKRAKTAE